MSRAALLVLATTGLVGAVACSAPAEPDLPVRTSPVAVVTMYADKCTVCHVRDRRDFATEPYTLMDDAELRALIVKMANQQANVALAPEEADEMTAFFKAMIAREPFVSVNRAEAGVLSGEATPGATVVLRWPTDQVVAARGGGDVAWRATIPAGLRLADAEIQARLGTATTRLRPTMASHSHAVVGP